MTLDLEAVARAMFASADNPILWCDHSDKTRNYYRGYAKIAAEMIRADVLEEAAKVAVDWHQWGPTATAAAIRSLKEQP